MNCIEIALFNDFNRRNPKVFPKAKLITFTQKIPFSLREQIELKKDLLSLRFFLLKNYVGAQFVRFTIIFYWT